MIIPIILLHFSLFIVAHSNPGENVEKFNEFIKINFGLKPSSSSSSHAHAHVQHLNYVELSKFLFQIEEKVANGVLHEDQPKIDDIYKEFQNAITTKESSMLGNLLPSRHDKEKHEQLKTHLATFYQDEQGKAQFIMLLLSFATRVAYTMGSEVLKKQRWTRKIQMNSFLHAFDKMEKAFHVENVHDNAKYRHYYYQDANLYPNDKDNNMRFEFVKIPGPQAADLRKYNHEKLILFSQQKHHRVSRLIKVLEQILQYSHHHENFSDREYFFTDFMIHWNQNYPNPEYTKVKMFALKRFGMNLASHILRQEKDNLDARAYFNYHGPAKDKLKNLLEKLKKAVEELGPFDINNEADLKFMNEQEMFLHYEDALELDWQTASSLNSYVRPLFWDWGSTMLACTSITAKTLKVNQEKIKENEGRVEEIMKENEARIEELNKENKKTVEGIKKEFDEKKAFFESLMVDYDIASLGHDFAETLRKMSEIAHKLSQLSTKVLTAIQEEFHGLSSQNVE